MPDPRAPAAALSAAELAMYEAEHQPYHGAGGTCCEQCTASSEGYLVVWPCAVARLVGEVRRLRAALSHLAECGDDWIDRNYARGALVGEQDG